MKVFLTGGMGFIGSYIAVELLKQHHQVTILARNPRKVPALADVPGVSAVQGGMADFDVIAKSLPGHDAVIHNALYWGNTPTDMLHNDTRCSIHLFSMAADAGVKRIVYNSSTATMGQFRPDMNEESKPKPTDYYGATKVATEAYLLAFGSKASMLCNVVRPGYTMGNPVVPGAFIYSDKRFRTIVQNALSGADISLTKNDGTQFIWAGDLAKIFVAAMESDHNRDIYFGLSKNWTSWEAIARQAVEMTASKSKIVLQDKANPDRPHMFDMGKIQREFGFAFDSTQAITDHLKYLIDHKGNA